MRATDTGRLGPWIGQGVAHTETRLRGVPTCHGRIKLKVKPEFSTLNRPKHTNFPHAAADRGERTPPGERPTTSHGCHRVARGQHTALSQAMSEVLRHAQASGWRSSEEGDRLMQGVTPAACQYPSSAAGFRRRALFFEKSPCADQCTDDLSGHFTSAA